MIVVSNSCFNCYNNLLSFSFDKATTGTYNLASVTLDAEVFGLLIPTTGLLPTTASLYALLVNIQFGDQVKVKNT